MKKEKKDKHFIKKPVYPGGIKAMREFIASELKYPKEALEQKIEGTVKLRYDIDYKGNVFNTYILSSIGFGCDEEAERIVKKFKFTIDKNRNVKVVFHKDIQIHFRLPKVKEAPVKPPEPARITQVQYQYTTTKSESNEPASNKIVYTYTIKTNK